MYKKIEPEPEFRQNIFVFAGRIFVCYTCSSLSMHKNDKQKSTESETDLNTNEKPKEEWLDAESTKGSEPGSSPGSDERPREVWIDEKDKKKK